MDVLTTAEVLNERLRFCEIRTQELTRSSISSDVEKLAGQSIGVGDLVDCGAGASPQDGNHGGSPSKRPRLRVGESLFSWPMMFGMAWSI